MLPRAAFLAVLLATTCHVDSVQGQRPQPPPQQKQRQQQQTTSCVSGPRTLSVTGQGMTSAPPDMATVSAGVSTLALTATEALNENNMKMNAIMDTAMSAPFNISQEDIQTTGFNVYAQYEYPSYNYDYHYDDYYVEEQQQQNDNNNFNNNMEEMDMEEMEGNGQNNNTEETEMPPDMDMPPEKTEMPPQPQRIFIGYNVNNNIRITLRNVDLLGDLLDALVRDGSTEMYGVDFGLSDSTAILNQAREMAVKDAIMKAKLYATAADVTLGSVLSITEAGAASTYYDKGGYYAEAAYDSVPVSPGQRDVSASISIIYEITD